MESEKCGKNVLDDYFPKTGSKELSWIVLLIVIMLGGYVVRKKKQSHL
jgi:LPXTG-motif cell wall-anchored protein